MLQELLEKIAAGVPSDQLRALTSLRGQLDLLETEIVTEALRGGASWSDIGGALSISKQAAHKRHRRPIGAMDRAAEIEHAGRPILVTPEARRAVRLARQEAAAMQSPTTGTEHLLLGVIRARDPEVAEVLRELGVSLIRTREAIQSTVEVPLAQARAEAVPQPDAHDESAARRGPVISTLARRVLKEALDERYQHGRGGLSAPDLLEALLRDHNGGAARTLQRLGVTATAVQAELDRVRSQTPR